MSQGSTEREASPLSHAGQSIVEEELAILGRVKVRLERDAATGPNRIENLDAQMIELRDAIAEAKEEDVASLIDQMHQVAALSAKRGKGRSVPVDPHNPYFGHLCLRDAGGKRERHVLIGRNTLLSEGDGVTIVDWRNAPVSRLYYRYNEGDEYEEEFDDRVMEGYVVKRRSVAVYEGDLRRIAAPQGTFARDGRGNWREALGVAEPSLAGGSGAAIRVPRNQLGVNDEDDVPRADKHLQEITALIDRQQFELITQPESGTVLIQGGAGSGKTTVALHRVAYLTFQDPRRFAPSKIVVIVFNDALVEYIRHVLPSLGVEGVNVTTYRRWSSVLIKRLKLPLPAKRTNDIPDAVARFKKHPVILRMIDELVEEQVTAVRETLLERSGEAVTRTWDEYHRLAPVVRAQRTLAWLGKAHLPAVAKAAAETVLRASVEQFDDIIEDWLELNTSETRIRDALERHAPGGFSPMEMDTIVAWCERKADVDLENPRSVDDASVVPDREDDVILLRLLQVKHGGIFVGNRRFEYEHLVVDEAQDLCPIEVRVLLDCVSAGKSVTIAGDRAQKMIFDNGFRDWPTLLADAGLPHTEIQPLKITYRSTRQVMEVSRHILGPLHDPTDELVARAGAPVGFFPFGDVGECVAFLGEALRGLMRREPSASVALISRYPQQADVYYEALRVAEVPRLRRVRQEDFSFSPGIDVTDVRQVKGLEFDYVVLLDATRHNYPEETQARHLLHIAATRAAYQLWGVAAGQPSKLLPPDLVATGVQE